MYLASSSSSSNDDIIQDYDFNSDLKEKDVFVSKEILSKCFYILTEIKKFQFGTTQSNSNSLELKCLKDGCQWYVHASRYMKSDLWMLRKYISYHDCYMDSMQSTHMQASSSVIGNCLEDDFRFRSIDQSLQRDIIYKARTKLGVNISYEKAWRAK